MKVSEAVAQLGIDTTQLPGDLVIVQLGRKGARNYLLADVGDKTVDRDLYITSGAFAPGTITDYGGRAGENVQRVLWLPIDCDFKDYIPNTTKEELWEWSDGDLMTAAYALESDLRELMAFIGVPVHRIDYTGYGLCAYVNLAPNGPDDLATVKLVHKALVQRINTEWKGTLADPAVSDAGSRFTRLVPCPNTKGGKVRQTKTIYREDGQADPYELAKTLKARTATTVGRAIPRTGSMLSPATMHDFIDVISRNWVDGRRHGLALALAGMLAKAGVAEDQARSIIEYAAHGDPEIEDRLKAVETSYARARAGLETRGLYGLRDWLPADAVEWIDRTLDEVRVRSAEVTWNVSNNPPPLHSEPLEDLHVLPIPEVARQGLIGEYIALMRPTTEASEGYHLGVALTVASAMIGRTVYANYGGPMYANLFTLLVGASGKSRKDTAIKRGLSMLRTSATQGTNALTSGVKVTTDVTSAEGLIGSLSQHPNIMLYLTEFSRLMGNANRKGTGTIVPVLMEAFDTPDVLSNLSKLNPVEAHNAYVTILSATQPRILDGLISDEHVHSGFINRWLIITGKGTAPISWPRTVDSAAVGLLFQEMHAAIHDAGAGPRSIDVSPAAMPYWDEWYRAQWSGGGSDDESAMSVRHPVMVIKIALIYAVLNGDQVIGEDHLRVGTAIVEWMWAQLAPLLPNWGSSPLAKLEMKILQALEQRGPMKRRDIARLVSNPRRWTSNDIKQTLDSLIGNGVLAADSTGVIGIRND